LLASGTEAAITAKQAREIAIRHAQEVGYETGAMTIEVSEWPTTFSRFVAEKPRYSRNALLQRQLQKNAFWLVTFIPAASRDVDGGIIVQFGGDIQVCVDARTGAVLADLRGK
jgi:hypothetical protein